MSSRQRRHAHGRATSGSSRTTVTLTVVGVVVAALLAVAGVVALVRGGGDPNAPGAAAASTSRPSTSSSSPTPSASASTSAHAQPSASAPAVAKPPASKHASSTFSGRGSQVLKITKPGGAGAPALVVATHRGSGTFGVLALDSTMHEGDILINVAGAYRGMTLLDSQGTQTQNLEVRTRGPWTLTIKPVTAARSMDLRATGTGDDVLRYSGPKGLATFAYRGGLNFVVSFHGAARNAVLVDRVGQYHGQANIAKGPALIAVKANGAWMMRVAP